MKCKYIDSGMFSIKNNKKVSKKIVKINDDYMFDIDDSSNNMSRILSYKNTGAMIISACRNERTEKENLEKTKELESDIRNKGLGFRPSLGGYVENLENPEESVVEEISFMIPKPSNMGDSDFLKLALEWCKKYDQESVLIILPNINNGNPTYLTGNGNIDFEFDNMRITNPDDQYYTKLIKGTTPSFTFTKEDSMKNKFNFISNSDLTFDSINNYYIGKLFPKSTKVWGKPYFNTVTGEFEPEFKERF